MVFDYFVAMQSDICLPVLLLPFFKIVFASLCLFFMYFMLEDGSRHSLPGTHFASPLNYLLWCFCETVNFSGFDFPTLHKKWSFPIVVINSFFSRSSPQFFRAEACNFFKKQTLAQVFKFYQISKDTYSYRTPSVAASAYCFSFW